MSTATNGAATEAAFRAITRATKDAGTAVADAAAPVGPAIELAQSNTRIVTEFATNYSNAARGLFNK